MGEKGEGKKNPTIEKNKSLGLWLKETYCPSLCSFREHLPGTWAVFKTSQRAAVKKYIVNVSSRMGSSSWGWAEVKYRTALRLPGTRWKSGWCTGRCVIEGIRACQPMQLCTGLKGFLFRLVISGQLTGSACCWLLYGMFYQKCPCLVQNLKLTLLHDRAAVLQLLISSHICRHIPRPCPVVKV